MDHLMQQVRKALVDTQQLMRNLSHGHGNQQVLEVQIGESIQQLEQDCYRLETYARKEIPQRRQEAKYQVDQVTSEVNELKRVFDGYKHRRQKAEFEAKQREELLSRRFVPNSAEATIQIDHSQQHNSQLKNANAQLDEIIFTGQSTHTSLKSQYLTLKGVQRRILDIMNVLGISNTVMRMIERRTQQDKWIFWTGLLITISLMVLAFIYFA